MNREYEELFKNPKKDITFARAFKLYLRDHEEPMYAYRIAEFMGTIQCTEVDDVLLDELQEELWPEGASPATINRHLFTPILATLHLVLKEKAPELQRPKGHNKVTPVIIPPEQWYIDLIPRLNPTQRAFVMCLAMHGRRTGEMLGRKPSDFDPEAMILDLGDTKTGVRQLELHPKVVPLLLAMPGWKNRPWLFGCGPNSGNSFRRDLKAAVLRAGLEWYGPHKFGRHMSVTRMLRRGYSVAHVADAHGMTPEMVTRRYGHLTKRETTAALHETGGELLDQVFRGGTVGEAIFIDAQKGPKIKRLLLPALSPSEGDTLSS